ncbi:MAG: phosphoglycerate dehydrogenase [Elusimicrobia bacterium]|nr:phosphoglycerate dehydrogenase [Elusimicrobiota bacterium]
MAEKRIFIIDFDSTFIQVEALDELAARCLKGRPGAEATLQRFREITEKGMKGEIPFSESLRRRLGLIRPDRKHLASLTRFLKRRVTRSFARNKDFFKKFGRDIYVVSGGFKDYMLPVLTPMGIPADHIFGNTFVFDEAGSVAGFDEKNPLCRDDGKAVVVRGLGLTGDISIIGDGWTDWEMKGACPGSRFVAFTENASRGSVSGKADAVARSFDEFLFTRGLPMRLSYPKSRIKALLLDNVSSQAAALLKDEGYSVEALPRSLPEPELAERLKDVHLLGIRSGTRIGEKGLAGAGRLLAVGVFAIGTNNVDLGACLRRGVAVFNAPFSSTRSVAELVVGEIVMLLRRVFERSAKLHFGVWDKGHAGCYEVRGKTLGIIGYGNIGSQVSVLAEALGMRVLYHDVEDTMALGNARKCRSMGEVLRKSDVVTVHVDGRAANEGLIAEREIRAMRPGAYLVNSSRGKIVDLAAAARALRSGRLGGAAVDVFPEEPRSNDEKFSCELAGMRSAILTPHIGGSTMEAQENIARFVTERVFSYVNNGDTLHSVNFPQVKLPRLVKSHRFLHIHRNVPGMLSRINTVFADHRINIEGQYLKTNEDIGYAITDICAKYDQGVMKALRRIPGTIRFRALY